MTRDDRIKKALVLSKENLWNTAFWVLFFLALTGVFIAIATGRISREHFYNSDALYLPALYKDFLSSYPMSGWKLTPSPYFFPDMALFFFLNALVTNYHIAIALYGLFQSILLLLGLLYLSKVVFGSQRVLRTGILWVMTVFFLFVSSGKYALFLPILQSAHHFGATVSLIFSLALVVRTLQASQQKIHIVRYWSQLFLLTGATVASDTVYLAQFIVPILLSLLLLRVFSFLTSQQVLTTGTSIALAIPVSISIKRWLVQFNRIQFFSPFDASVPIRAWNALQHWVQVFWKAHPILSGLWILFVAVSLVVLAFVLSRSTHTRTTSRIVWQDVCLLSFLLFSILSNVVIALLRGFTEPRYFLPTLLIPMFFGWPFLLGVCVRLIAFKIPSSRLYAMLVAFMIGFACFLTGFFSSFPHVSALATLSDYYPEFVQCVDENAARRNLRHGISEYWDAKHITMLSKKNLWIVQAQQYYHNALFPYHWINNLFWYDTDVEFVITRESPDDRLVLDEAHTVRRFGRPADRFSCDDKTILVYNRDDDIQFQQQFRFLPFFAQFERPQDEFDFYACFFLAQTGETIGLSRIANEGADASGYLVQGPGIHLPEGEYAFEIHYYADRESGERSGIWQMIDAISESNQPVFLQGVIAGQGKQSITGNFSLTTDADIVVRVFYEGTGVLLVNKVKIRKIQ